MTDAEIARNHLVELAERACANPSHTSCIIKYADRMVALTAAASGPVEQRVMDAIREQFMLHFGRIDWHGHFDYESQTALFNGIEQAVRAALAPASEEEETPELDICDEADAAYEWSQMVNDR